MCTQKVIYVSVPDKRVKFWLTGFGAGWLNEYLPMLQPQQKWFGVSPNINVGDLILIKDDSVKREAFDVQLKNSGSLELVGNVP